MSRIHPIIMAGGRGTRFWPASRETLPKQFLEIGGEGSLLTRTGARLAPLAPPHDTWVVTNVAHVGIAADHLPDIPRDQIVGEPVGRNTAPCIALAAALVAREDPEGVLVVAPADHWIGNEEEFRATIEEGVRVAREEKGLVTFGVVPTGPETGYGYIEAGEELAGQGSVARVVRFTEKPDRPTAEKFLAGGRHYWNSGIFAWRADVFLEELARQHPDMAAECRRMAQAVDRGSALETGYPSLTSISVDYAVLEHSDNVYVVPAEFPWSDVGSWDALADISPADGRGNVLEGDALAVGSTGCFVRSTSRFVSVVGAKDLIVVDLPDALLVCSKERTQDVKKVVEALEKAERRDLL
ncbi:MAG: mannose-1-phosphate guanylyltransferase [Gemmatimonadetes bacterium]|nr:mannose-1-phosphate guanylyltransferase [Gemmatimonadota bacterium]